MPNAGNAGAPLTLVGIGRSGTSLLEFCFRAHPNIQSLGETSGLIFGTASGAHSTLIPCAKFFKTPYDLDGHAVRQLLIALEPSGSEMWFHKPIGIPKLISWWQLPGEKTRHGFPIEWYGKVLDAAFPQGKYFTCLRNPWDVVLSWHRFTGWSQADLWRDVAISYTMLRSRLDRFKIVLFFDDLIERPTKTLGAVFAALDLPMVYGALTAYDEPRSMNGNKIMASHKEEWASCEAPNVSDEDAAEIVAVWQQMRRSFESPERYRGVFRF